MLVSQGNWVGTELSDGRYVVVDEIGEGGMALVYLAEDRELGKQVAIKVPKLSILAEPGFAQRFQQEIRSLVQLEHPHICRISGVGEHAGFPFAVLQHLGGGSAQSRRPRDAAGCPTPVPVDEILRWLPDYCRALDFVHAQGMVHRDVKPENMMFDAHDHVYVSDFGIAKVVSDSRDAAHPSRGSRLTPSRDASSGRRCIWRRS